MEALATTQRRARGAAAAFRLRAFALDLAFALDVALDLPGPLGAAVRAGRKGPAGGGDRSPRLFAGAWMPRQKARPALTYPQAA